MSKHKLLLADDSITIQKVVNLTFADEGIEVITVGDGDAAMQKFTEVMPDLVMADVNMPGLDGYRICEKIKQNSDTKKIPVILLVGSFEPFDEAEARRVGADGFLTKPFQSIRQLVNKVSDLIDSKNGGQESAVSDEDSATPDISFEDTLAMHSFDEPESSSDELGDAGMDDEMIQTAQIGSLPVDESQKFVSKPVDESFAEDVDLTALKQPYNFEISIASEKEDWAKTQPLSREDYEEIIAASTKSETVESDDSLYEFDGRQEFAEDETAQIYPGENRISQTSLPSEIPSDSEFDNFDLLEFPGTAENPGFSETKAQADSEIPGEISDASQNVSNEISGEQSETLDASTQLGNLSPATIDAIADKVAEKISDEIIKRVVSEVIAQMEKRK